MPKVSPKCVAIGAVAILLVLNVEVVGKRKRFYARESDDLKHVAQTEIDFLSHIRSYKESLSQGGTTPGPLLPILDA